MRNRERLLKRGNLAWGALLQIDSDTCHDSLLIHKHTCLTSFVGRRRPARSSLTGSHLMTGPAPSPGSDTAADRPKHREISNDLPEATGSRAQYEANPEGRPSVPRTLPLRLRSTISTQPGTMLLSACTLPLSAETIPHPPCQGVKGARVSSGRDHRVGKKQCRDIRTPFLPE